VHSGCDDDGAGDDGWQRADRVAAEDLGGDSQNEGMERMSENERVYESAGRAGTGERVPRRRHGVEALATI
jgi:hypothetical protein